MQYWLCAKVEISHELTILLSRSRRVYTAIDQGHICICYINLRYPDSEETQA